MPDRVAKQVPQHLAEARHIAVHHAGPQHADACVQRGGRFIEGARFAGAASAQSNVTLFGVVDQSLNNVKNGSVSYKLMKSDQLSSNRFGVRGEEDLGGGMSAYFMCSTSMDITGGSASNMCARNSVIGLKAGWGSLDWGNMDTPAKRLAAQFDPFPISAAMGQGAQMWNSTASNVSNGGTPASFSRRQQNLITYNMPTMNGFDASFAWSAANEATGSTSASTIQKPRMWSAMAAYTNGPLALGVAYERHVDYNPGQLVTYNGSNDTMYTLGAGYTLMGSLRVSGVYNSINYNNITAGQDMSVKTWGIYGDWAVSGPHRIRLGYGSQGSTKGTYNGGTAAQVGSWTANAGAGQTGAQKIRNGACKAG